MLAFYSSCLRIISQLLFHHFFSIHIYSHSHTIEIGLVNFNFQISIFNFPPIRLLPVLWISFEISAVLEFLHEHLPFIYSVEFTDRITLACFGIHVVYVKLSLRISMFYRYHYMCYVIYWFFFFESRLSLYASDDLRFTMIYLSNSIMIMNLMDVISHIFPSFFLHKISVDSTLLIPFGT